MALHSVVCVTYGTPVLLFAVSTWHLCALILSGTQKASCIISNENKYTVQYSLAVDGRSKMQRGKEKYSLLFSSWPLLSRFGDHQLKSWGVTCGARWACLIWHPYMKPPESEDVTDSQSNRLLLLTITDMANKTPGRSDRESGKRVKLWVSVLEEMTAMRNWTIGFKKKGTCDMAHIRYLQLSLFYFYCMLDFSGCLASRSPCVRFVCFGSTIAIRWKENPIRVGDYFACVVFSVSEKTQYGQKDSDLCLF